MPDRWSLREGLFRDGGLEAAGVAHGVSARALGDMKAPAARAAALAAAGLAGEPVTLRQVHGTRVVEVNGPGPSSPARRLAGPSPALRAEEGDALVTAATGVTLAVFVADCMPVFALDPRTRSLGLAHAGWRGTRAGVVPALLAALKARGARAADLVVAIGPHVGPCCYVVSPETARLFPAPAVRQTPAGTVVDLAEAALLQLGQAGVPRAAVSVCGRCTASNPEELFSFRRDKSDQRMMAFAALR